MKKIRILLYKLFGLKCYLRIISKIYIFITSKGLFQKRYPELFYLKKLIKPGFVCVDIGANLGYYSYHLAKLCGNKGFVYAIEPVNILADIWNKNLSKYKNVRLYNYALGEKNGFVKMAMPFIDGVLHHGMTKIHDQNKNSEVIYFDVEMVIADELFEDLERIDYIKIDVEGYESLVIDNMLKVIKTHKPIIQAELSGIENRNQSIKILTDIGYNIYILKYNDLRLINENEILKWEGDFYFIYK